jgi:hypothetical protein
MGFYVWTELVCAHCAVTTAGRYSCDRIRRKDMEKDAKRNRWVRIGDDWVCSEYCRKNHEETERERETQA